MVIDPRAGHGPGIGGFKIDSEIGIALKSGHPCYFVMFFPQPLPGQTIESVCSAEIAFMRKLRELHPDPHNKPFVIGNCQGGWALMMLAALAPDLVGPILLAGSPLSYWAGVGGKNPLRYTGGLLGGTWLSSLTGDLGHGKFDGAYLVNNFENLNPSNTYWTKLYNLYSKIDTEGPRFLEFEKWWGGHYLLNKEEMDWIAQNLFVGNKLAAGEVESFDGKHRVDIRNIRSPIVVFASWGDNITPPQQALNWILDLYASDDEIRLNEQTIVYCLHEKIGHLGIFVSASVAKRETAELASALELIDTLPPGLYEALITDTTPDMPGLEYVQGRYLIQFKPRSLDDLRALDDGRGDERAFEVVNRVSEINQGLYNTFASPLVKALSSEAGARLARDLNPARMERWIFSDLNPWMWWVKAAAEAVRANRQPVAADNPFVQAEKVRRSRSSRRSTAIATRATTSERLFKALYESPWLAAAVGIEPGRPSQRARALRDLGARGTEAPEAQRPRARGGGRHARRCLGAPRALRRGPRARRGRRATVQHGAASHRGNQAREHALARDAESRDQAAGLRARHGRGKSDRGAAEARPRPQVRRRGYDAARKALAARGELTPHQVERLRRVAAVLGLDQPVQEHNSMSHEKYKRLIEAAQAHEPVATAVAHPCDELADRRGRRREARPHPADPGRAEAQDPGRGAEGEAGHRGLRDRRRATQPRRGGESSRARAAGKAEALMKGALHTDELMAEVVKRETGLRTARRISHCFVLDVPAYENALIISDAAVNIAPTLKDKVHIVQNAIDLARAFRWEPRVAVLSAMETVNPDVPSTVEAAALCKMADRGQITGGVLDGPLALDNAISLEAAAIKKIASPVAGRANVLIVPDLEAGNMLAKSLSFLAKADAAGIVLGAKVPIILTSRADSHRRLASCAVASLVAATRRDVAGRRSRHERRDSGSQRRVVEPQVLALRRGPHCERTDRRHLHRAALHGARCRGQAGREALERRREARPRRRARLHRRVAEGGVRDEASSRGGRPPRGARRRGLRRAGAGGCRGRREA